MGYYIDTLPQNEAKYVYRVKGVSPFGITGPYSDTVSTRGTDRVRAIPQITQHNMDGEAVHLVWEFPENELKKIKGFKVLRGLSDKELNQDISRITSYNVCYTKLLREFVRIGYIFEITLYSGTALK